MPALGYSHRPVALGAHGLVAAAYPVATLAGLERRDEGRLLAGGADPRGDGLALAY